jgi:serine/threonine protein kinase/Tfp pilus assembly protein PilF
MGAVYKAEDLRLERLVALKVISDDREKDVQARERLTREAKAVAKLDHPNICQIYEIDEHQGQIFIAMAYVEGRTLRQILSTGPLDVDTAIDIAIQVAQALQEAHDKGIIHRDLKCANIMLTRGGQVKVMDFGLARMEGMEITKPHSITGTIAYMSPEQAEGKPTDLRTDIWSLGVVLYRMLTGARPFQGNTASELISSILKDRPQRMKNVFQDVPELLEYAVQKMLQKNRDERYENMATLIADLERVRQGADKNGIQPDRRRPSIAVLPFVDMSPQKDQEYFCDGLAEEIINALAQLKNIRVIARSSTFAFKGMEKDIRDIGRELNVDAVLEGSVRKAGHRLRITGQLISVDDGHHLWSERYDREMGDIFAIQDEITLAIVDKLKVKLLEENRGSLCKCQEMDVETYDLYLRARHSFNKWTEEGIKAAIEPFKQVIKRVPDCALGYSGLADCYNVLPFFSAISPRRTYFLAKEAALKALELDDTLGEAHTSLASILIRYEWNWQDSEKEYKRALELNPGYATAHHWYAMYLMYATRFSEAIEEIKQAHELNPLSPMINETFGQILFYAGFEDMAIDKFKRAIELDTVLPYAHLQLAGAYFQKGMLEEGLAEIEKERQICEGRNPTVEAFLASFVARIGMKDEAVRTLRRLLNLSKKTYVSPYAIARIYLALEENDEGFKWLQKAYEECDHWLCFLKVHPVRESFSSDSRFSDMLKKIGFEKS